MEPEQKKIADEAISVLIDMLDAAIDDENDKKSLRILKSARSIRKYVDEILEAFGIPNKGDPEMKSAALAIMQSTENALLHFLQNNVREVKEVKHVSEHPY